MCRKTFLGKQRASCVSKKRDVVCYPDTLFSAKSHNKWFSSLMIVDSKQLNQSQIIGIISMLKGITSWIFIDKYFKKACSIHVFILSRSIAGRNYLHEGDSNKLRKLRSNSERNQFVSNRVSLSILRENNLGRGLK